MPDAVEAAFASATRMLFGKALSPMRKYSAWLSSRVPAGKSVKSALGSGSAYIPDYAFFREIPERRAVSFESMGAAAGEAIQKPAGSFEAIAAGLGSFAYFVPTFEEGRNIGIENVAGCIDCLNVRDSFDPFTTKNSAHCFSVMGSEAIFGTYRVVKSAFSLHCYNCVGMKRCFEMDGCKNCNDSMFCHNCEGMDNCMFCFNAKNLRYAIGNLELGKEKYPEARKRIVGRILGELEAGGGLGFDIYNVLCRKGDGRASGLSRPSQARA